MRLNKPFCLSVLIFLPLLFLSSKGFSQLVPFYPIEIFFCPVGYSNGLPGCKPDLYSTFSSLKVVLNKDLPSLDKIGNTISFVANIIEYHDITKSRNYHPFSLAPTLTTHFFATDIFTLGIDLIGNMEFLPGLDLNSNMFNYQNYRVRIRPFHYLILTPDLILQQLFTYGRSINSDKIARMNSQNRLELISNDYSLWKYELKLIYFTKFHTRIFFIPYAFQTQYDDVAVNEIMKIDKTIPKLNEEGFGLTLGMRYSTFTWGYAEGSFEYEKSIDRTYGGNSYDKFKFDAKWENQYFTERFGYLMMFQLAKHNSNSDLTDYKSFIDTYQELGQVEIRADVMPIFNINRNVSLRPEFDLVRRIYTDKPNTTSYRYWLHLHVLF